MAKSHTSFKKRRKELARKLKQEEKRQHKLNIGTTPLRDTNNLIFGKPSGSI